MVDFSRRSTDTEMDDEEAQRIVNEFRDLVEDQGGVVVGAIQNGDETITLHAEGPCSDETRLLARSQAMMVMLMATGWLPTAQQEERSKELLEQHLKQAQAEAPTQEMRDTLGAMLEFSDNLESDHSEFDRGGES